MLKRLFVVFFFLCLFTGNANAQIFPPAKQSIPKPAELKFVPNQFIVQYKPGMSPQQLTVSIAKEKKVTQTPLGFLKTHLPILLGRKTQLALYEDYLHEIEKATMKAKVVSSEPVSLSLESQIVKLSIEDGASLSQAIKIFQNLFEVKSVQNNYYKFTSGSHISSTEGTSGEIVPNKYIIQYAPGQSPQEIQQKVTERTQSVSSVFGQIRTAVENAGIALTGTSTPEKKLEQINMVTEEVGQKNQTPLLTETETLPTDLKNMFVVKTDGETSTSETIEAYQSIPEVVSVEPVRYVYTNNTPNDIYFNLQWDMQKIQAPTAWDTTQGSDNVIVAVIDSGVDYNHPDLAAHVIKGPNYINNTLDPMDNCGHGTHVSGTIGALTNNGIGVSGINWNVKILAIKAMGPMIDPSTGKTECGGDDTNVLSGIQYAADHGAKVINMSLGSPGACYSSYQSFINYAISKGVTVVTAAGNNNANSLNGTPGNCNGVINVGATGPNDERAIYSNYGSLVSISAPGGSAQTCMNATCILSTFIQNGQQGYGLEEGTSMAAPHVAGAAALLLSINPNLSPAQIKNYLIGSADVISTDRPIGPRLNLAKAVSLISGSSTPTPTPTGISSSPTSEPSNTPTPNNSPTPTETSTPTPTDTASPTPTTSPTTTPSPTEKPNSGLLKISYKLPGIGTGANENGTPQHTTHAIDVDFIGENGEIVDTSIGAANYNNGVYSGDISLIGIPPGTYQIKLHIFGMLNKLLPGFYTIQNNQIIETPTVSLIPGDINQDNILDLLDYNILVFDCIMQKQGVICSGSTVDLNDDGVVDAKDLNIFLRQLDTRNGD